MGQKEKVYSEVTEAREMIKQLCEKYPDELWAVRPENVSVLGVENKKRGKKNRTLAKIIPIKGAEKAIMKLNNIETRYIIEIYWADWREWKERFKQWVVFHELQHIGTEVGKTVKHDCEDFRMIIDVLGVAWTEKPDELPNLLGEEKIKFDLTLRANMVEYQEENKEKEESDEIFDD